jgi:phosphate transport system substrate-binding protein
MVTIMNIRLLRLAALIALIPPVAVNAIEITGAGSMIPVPLMRVWGQSYTMYTPGTVIKYQGSTPAEGIKKLVNNEVDFCSVDMPLSVDELKKKGLIQFPFALGAIGPMVNLPNVSPGLFKLDGQVLGDIFLGNIKKWNDPAIVALNPKIQLPDENIIVIHRFASHGVRTMIGDFLAKNNSQWKAAKGDSMGGDWPVGAIEVKSPIEHFEMINKNQYSIGYGSLPLAMKYKLAYIKLKNKAGNFVSPSDENVSAAAVNAKWDENDGFDVVLTDQPGATSWPMTNTSFILMRKVSAHPERSREVLKYFKYSLRYGGLQAVQYDYIPLPDSVTSIIRASWNSVVDEKGVPVLKE